MERGRILPFLRERQNKQSLTYGNVAEIKLSLEINPGLVNKWIREGMEGESVITIFEISSDLNHFSNYLEQFILRGKNVKAPISRIELREGENSDYLLCKSNITGTVNPNNKEEFYEALLDIKHKVKDFVDSSNYTLICNMKVFRDTRIQHIENLLGVKDWIDIKDNDFVCILNGEDYYPPSLIFKENLDVRSAYGGGLNTNLRYGFLVYWCGALEIKNKDSIQCIKIEY